MYCCPGNNSNLLEAAAMERSFTIQHCNNVNADIYVFTPSKINLQIPFDYSIQ